MSKLNLQIITMSTRPTRIGPVLAEWIQAIAQEHGQFAVQTVDLADFNLPVFDEPEHPLKQQYQNQHTKKWAAKISEADAFIFVTPEYDYFSPAPLVNAVQYLSKEWHYKPVGLFSYGGLSGGLRSAQATKLLVTAVKMMPMAETLAIPFASSHLTENNQFQPEESATGAAQALLDELLKWATALKPMRN